MQRWIDENAAQHDGRTSPVTRLQQLLVSALLMFPIPWVCAQAQSCADVQHRPSDDVAHRPSADVSADSTSLSTQPFDLAIPLTRDVVRDGRLLGRAPVANLTVKSDGAVTIKSPVIGDKPAIIAPCKPEVSTPAPRRR